MAISSSKMSRMGGCLSAIVSAALSGCGGGHVGNGDTLDMLGTDAAALSLPTVHFSTAKGNGHNGSDWVKIADESGTFTLASAQTVRFGSGNKWVAKVVSGAGQCTTAFFDAATSPGASKECDVLITSVSDGVVPAPVVEPAPAPAPVTTTDPAPTLALTTTTAPAPAPAPAPTPSWTKIAGEGQNFALFGPIDVRFGAGTKWITKSVNGTASCSPSYFGSDPAVGTLKECQMYSSGTAIAPKIDTTKLAASNLGFSEVRVTAANVADPIQNPAPADIGSFREPCAFSHMSFDDPIVFPGQPGKAHLHTFFGNTGSNASTTATSLATTGNSTCAGGTANRTSYWVPALIDTRTGTPIKPSNSIFYYKTGANGVNPASVQALPQGLRMVSGNPNNTLPGSVARYGCVGLGNDYWAGSSIPVCAAGQDMLMEVAFPQCWDGVNLDSPDHISHMSNPVNGVCPTSHPVPVPVISFEVHYTVTATDAPAKWRLSSDNYDPALPGGLSGHGDWFNGWDPAIMSTFIKNCEQKSMDCHAYLLGDGRTLY